MSSKEKIKISKVTEEEREVLILLEKMDNCLYGNIFKKLKLSHTKGAAIIRALKTKGYIQSIGNSSIYELNVELSK